MSIARLTRDAVDDEMFSFRRSWTLWGTSSKDLRCLAYRIPLNIEYLIEIQRQQVNKINKSVKIVVIISMRLWSNSQLATC